MYVRVQVQPGAKKERVEEVGGVLRIAVREPAERNLANERVRELVARHHGVPRAQVRIVAGHHSPVKMVVVSS